MHGVTREWTQRRLFACVAVYFLSTSSVWISGAYAAMLAPAVQSSEEPGSGTLTTKKSLAETPAAPAIETVEVREVGKIAPRSDSLLGDMLNTAKTNPSMLLWSMYPASVRGRIFGGNMEASPPSFFNGGGGGGW